MWNSTRVAQKLGIEFPIIQGPFGGGFSSVDLVATVSNAGGLGSFGAHHLDGDAIRALAKEIRSATNRPFAINLWVSDHDPGGLDVSRDAFDRAIAALRPYFAELGVPEPAAPPQGGSRLADQAEAILDAAPPVFSFVYGVPDASILAECRRRSILTAGTATTVEEAVALDQAGVDIVVATGFEAGGHRVSFLRSAEDSLTGTFALVPQVADAIAAPVVAAGGIADTRGIRAALALGAEGVQIGTAFLACDESNATPLHRAKLFSPDGRRTGLTRAFTGRLARGIRNHLMDDVAYWLPYPAQSQLLAPLKAAALAQGRADLLALWSGQAAALLKHHRAADLFASLVEGMARD